MIAKTSPDLGQAVEYIIVWNLSHPNSCPESTLFYINDNSKISPHPHSYLNGLICVGFVDDHVILVIDELAEELEIEVGVAVLCRVGQVEGDDVTLDL